MLVERDPVVPNFMVSNSSVRNILRDASHVFKASHPSRAVIFTPYTALACANYAHGFRRFHELTGAGEHTIRLLFANGSAFNLGMVPMRIWAQAGLPARHVVMTEREPFLVSF